MKRRILAGSLVAAAMLLQGCAVVDAWNYALDQRKNYHGPTYVTAGYIKAEPSGYRVIERR